MSLLQQFLADQWQSCNTILQGRQRILVSTQAYKRQCLGIENFGGVVTRIGTAKIENCRQVVFLEPTYRQQVPDALVVIGINGQESPENLDGIIVPAGIEVSQTEVMVCPHKWTVIQHAPI